MHGFLWPFWRAFAIIYATYLLYRLLFRMEAPFICNIEDFCVLFYYILALLFVSGDNGGKNLRKANQQVGTGWQGC